MKKTGIVIIGMVVLAMSCKKSVNPEDRPTACALAPNPGPCEAYIPKYYFDEESGKCKEFIWGGCGGTVPFDTMEECEECECY